METKAYFASSVPAALEVARQELGENALLVGSRPAPPDVRQFGKLEVTFAWDPISATNARRAGSASTSIHTTPMQPASIAHPSQPSDMEEIRQQLSLLRTALARGTAAIQIPDEQELTAERLVRAGLSREMAAEVGASAAERPGNRDAAVLTELASRMLFKSFGEMKIGESRTLAFIGPPGRGKTSSLVKIAMSMGLARRVPVRIYCAGAHCVGGQEQLARYAAILGAPFQAFESMKSLDLALNGEGWKGLVLIDTPGMSPADRNELAEMESFFSARPGIEKHLVLRADASSADMLKVLSRFSGLNPARLLFTGIDESARLGSVAETLLRASVPATFCGTGQRIPEDLEELSLERLARAVWMDGAAFGDSLGVNTRFAQAAA